VTPVLEEVRIRGLGVIDDAVLPLGAGLTVVTGETGAGKTMVVTGLLLLFGGRADAARVRAGAESAIVDGRLEVEPASTVADRVRDAGGDLDDGSALVLRRVVSATGRSRAYVGGAPAPLAVLGELAEQLLAVHGQSDQLRLTRPAQQRGALDRFAGVDLSDYAAAFTAWRHAEEVLRDTTARMGELRRESDLLGHGIGEIAAAAPRPGKDVELAAAAARLAHADALRLAAHAAHDALVGDADAPMAEVADASGLLAGAARTLAQQGGADPLLDALADRVSELATLAFDLGAELGAYREQLDADPALLEQLEERRAVLTALVRKYAPEADVAAVLGWAEQAAARLADIDVSDEAIAALSARRDAAALAVARLASRLSERRRAAAVTLAEAVSGELAGLAMPTARLHVEVRPRAVTEGQPSLDIAGRRAGIAADGADDVEFLLQAHPGAPALALSRGASGGELSRVMLALELCLAGADPVPTMVFDEVDAGVGGRAAVEVGRRLARLARNRQVVVVTHLAQVAAFADQHIVVDKPSSGERQVTASDVRAATGAERVTELARMLAGSDTAAARDHAAELLADASAERTAAGAAAGGGTGDGRAAEGPVRRRNGRKAANTRP
jgi:DNA repair protein RecN (Recombination protein N)